jgi:hypothetical protein
MYRVSEMPEGIIPWVLGQTPFVILHCMISGIGMLGSVIILLTHIGAELQPNLLLTLSLVMGDVVLLTTTFTVDTINLSQGGFAVGRTGCVWEAMVILLGCFASVLSILASTVERYLHIIHQRSMTVREAWMVVGLLWFISMVGSWFPTFFGAQDMAYGLNSGLTVCVTAWWDSGFWANLTTVLAIISFLACSMAMFYCYYVIVSTYVSYSQKVARQQQMLSLNVTTIHTVWGASIMSQQVSAISDSAKSTESERAKGISFSQQERTLLTKALILTSTFMTMWSPYFVKFFMEMVTKTPASPLFDNLCNLGAVSNSFLNCILLFTLDLRIKRRLYHLVGWEL